MNEETRVRRFWERVHKTDGCWLWTGALNDEGYGAVRGPNKKNTRAHRFAYEITVGPIPPGLTLDHLCRTRNCVNPAHLEPVTNKENLLRGEGWAAKNARKTHCVHGHEFTPDNIYTIPGRTWRECRKCRYINGARKVKRISEERRLRREGKAA